MMRPRPSWALCAGGAVILGSGLALLVGPVLDSAWSPRAIWGLVLCAASAAPFASAAWSERAAMRGWQRRKPLARCERQWRRGLCPKCDYRVGRLARCPQCGEHRWRDVNAVFQRMASPPRPH